VCSVVKNRAAKVAGTDNPATSEHLRPAPASRATAPTIGGAALVFLAAALWATFGPIARILYDRGYSPLELASVRTWLGVAGAFAAALILRVRLPIARRDIPFFAAYGIVGFAAFETLLLASFRHFTVPVAISLLYTAPVFVLLLSHGLFGERITPAKKLALPLSIAGVLLVSGAAGAVLGGSTEVPVVGLLLGLGAGFGYALYTLFGRASIDRAHPVAAVFWSFLFAALALTVLAEPVGPLTRDIAALPWLLTLGIVPTLLPYLFYLRALKTVQPGTAAMLACVEPLIAALLAATLLNERLSVIQACGMGLIVGAAVLLVRPGRTKER
jgi:drug/metabolite transporter (DMT)-like permease